MRISQRVRVCLTFTHSSFFCRQPYLGNRKNRLNVILLDVEPMPEPGILGMVARTTTGSSQIVLELVGLNVLVLDVPYQLASFPQLGLVAVYHIEPVENFMRPETN